MEGGKEEEQKDVLNSKPGESNKTKVGGVLNSTSLGTDSHVQEGKKTNGKQPQTRWEREEERREGGGEGEENRRGYVADVCRLGDVGWHVLFCYDLITID